MFFHDWHPERRPLFHLGKIPIRVTGLIIIIFVCTAILHAITGGASISWFFFDIQTAVSSFQIWRFVTHPLAFSIANIWWAVGLFFFASFGGTVEAALGRTRYTILYLSLVLLSPFLIILCWLVTQLGLFDASVAQDWFMFGVIDAAQSIHFAIFLCVCRLHPDAPFLIPSVKLKWVAVVFVIVTCLEYILPRQWELLFLYLATIGYALWFLRGRAPLPQLTLWQDVFGSPFELPKVRIKRKEPVAGGTRPALKGNRGAKPPYEPKIRPRTELPDSAEHMKEIDRILEKISQSGIASLTKEEKAQLERASENLDRDRR